MSNVVENLLTVLGLDGADASKAAVLPDSWGFSSTPTLQQMISATDGQRRATTDGDRFDVDSSAADAEKYVSILESSPPFISNHSVEAMAEAYGLTHLTSSLSGSLLMGRDHFNAAAAAVQAIKQQVDKAWSAEAVRRGVGCAKSGDYQQALECYNKALDLDPGNCDAYVARGAAHANQKHFELAVADFQAALDRDPSNTNASKYLQATREHMQAAAVQKEAAGPAMARHSAREQSAEQQQQQPQQQPQQQQQQQQHQLPYRRTRGGEDGQTLQDRAQEQVQHNRGRESFQQQMQQPESNRRRSRRGSRSRSRGSSRSETTSGSSSGSDSFSCISDDDAGGGYKLLRGSTAADIKEAIELVRSAKKASREDKQKEGGSSSKKKKKRHKHKHSSKHKHRRRHKGHKRNRS